MPVLSHMLSPNSSIFKESTDTSGKLYDQVYFSGKELPSATSNEREEEGQSLERHELHIMSID